MYAKLRTITVNSRIAAILGADASTITNIIAGNQSGAVYEEVQPAVKTTTSPASQQIASGSIQKGGTSFSGLGRLATAVTNAFNGGPQPLQVGAKPYQASPGNLGSKGATYVPTKMAMTINLLPVATRQQQSQQFSLREYANGNLIKKGMW
jgi:hypothetical protein